MTPAERMRRHRQAKRDGISLAPARTIRRKAEVSGRSERWHYYAAVLERYGVSELQALVDPPHRLGVKTAAEIARTLCIGGQLLVARSAEDGGKREALATWRRLARIPGLLRSG